MMYAMRNKRRLVNKTLESVISLITEDEDNYNDVLLLRDVVAEFLIQSRFMCEHLEKQGFKLPNGTVKQLEEISDFFQKTYVELK